LPLHGRAGTNKKGLLTYGLLSGINNFYSKVWFNSPLLAAAERNQHMKVLGIKSDGIINFLSNEAPRQIMQRLKIPHGLPWGASLDTIQRTLYTENFAAGDMGITLGGTNGSVAEEGLNVTNVGTAF